jgi:hypothetical protein
LNKLASTTRAAPREGLLLLLRRGATRRDAAALVEPDMNLEPTERAARPRVDLLLTGARADAIMVDVALIASILEVAKRCGYAL